MPHLLVDPVVLAANILLRLRGIVSCEASFGSGYSDHGQCTRKVNRELSCRPYSTEIQRQDHFPTNEELCKQGEKCWLPCDELSGEASNPPEEPLIECTSQYPFSANDDSIYDSLASSLIKLFKEDLDPE